LLLSSSSFFLIRHTHTHLQRTPVGTTLTENSIPYVTLQLLSPPLLLFLLIYLSFARVFRIFFLPKKGRLRPWNRTGVSKFLSSVSSFPTYFHSTCCVASFHFPLLRFLKQFESSAIDLGSSENSVGANMTNVSAGGGVSVRQCPMNFVGFEWF
jgi:hypothetical protein